MPHVLLVVLTNISSIGYRNFNGNWLHFVTATFKILQLKRRPINGGKQHFTARRVGVLNVMLVIYLSIKYFYQVQEN